MVRQPGHEELRGFWVVSSFRTDNGANGQNEHTYSYADNRIDVRGGGVLGFARRTTKDGARNATVVEDYDTSSLGSVTPVGGSGGAVEVYAKLGLVTRREVTTVDPDFTRRVVSTFDYDFIPTNGARSYYSRTLQATTTDFEIRAGVTTQLAQRLETFSYDANGDLGLLTGSQVIRSTSRGGFVDITSATLVSDVPRWVLGVPTRTVQVSRATPAGAPRPAQRWRTPPLLLRRPRGVCYAPAAVGRDGRDAWGRRSRSPLWSRWYLTAAAATGAAASS